MLNKLKTFFADPSAVVICFLVVVGVVRYFLAFKPHYMPEDLKAFPLMEHALCFTCAEKEGNEKPGDLYLHGNPIKLADAMAQYATRHPIIAGILCEALDMYLRAGGKPVFIEAVNMHPENMAGLPVFDASKHGQA